MQWIGGLLYPKELMKARVTQHATSCYSFQRQRVAALLVLTLVGIVRWSNHAAEGGTSNTLHKALTLSQQSFHTKPHVELQRDFAAYRSLLPVLASTAMVASGETTETALFHAGKL